jgi:DNA-directed RNA polymerase specialized sigma24 family protein
MDAAAAAEKLGRTHGAILARRTKLRHPRPTPTNSGARWTKRECNILRARYPAARRADELVEFLPRFTAARGALTKLSPEHREIIDLVYYHEKSVDDAADILSIPRATVKTRMFYARKNLAELVQGA